MREKLAKAIRANMISAGVKAETITDEHVAKIINEIK